MNAPYEKETARPGEPRRASFGKRLDVSAGAGEPQAVKARAEKIAGFRRIRDVLCREPSPTAGMVALAYQAETSASRHAAEQLREAETDRTREP